MKVTFVIEADDLIPQYLHQQLGDAITGDATIAIEVTGPARLSDGRVVGPVSTSRWITTFVNGEFASEQEIRNPQPTPKEAT